MTAEHAHGEDPACRDATRVILAMLPEVLAGHPVVALSWPLPAEHRWAGAMTAVTAGWPGRDEYAVYWVAWCEDHWRVWDGTRRRSQRSGTPGPTEVATSADRTPRKQAS